MIRKEICPKCNIKQAQLIEEEVDIGVGIQRFTLGWICPDCGYIISCSECGSPTYKHMSWCSSLMVENDLL